MTAVLAGFVMGFLGSSHCIAMCGGLAAALPSASQAGSAGPATGRAADVRRTLAYNTGRTASYAVAGAIAGGAGAAFAGMGGATGFLVLRALSALLVIAVGLYIGGWSSAVVRIERVGSVLWRRIAPLARRARASDSALAGLAFGALWGWLPCGLVYSALVVAAASGSSATGAMVMAGFGLGTLPALVMIGVAAGRSAAWLRGTAARQLAGAMVLVFGLWTLVAAASATAHMVGHAASCHEVGTEVRGQVRSPQAPDASLQGALAGIGPVPDFTR